MAPCIMSDVAALHFMWCKFGMAITFPFMVTFLAKLVPRIIHFLFDDEEKGDGSVHTVLE